jgi:hypothetical protein
MKLLAHICCIAEFILLGPALRLRESEIAVIDTWIDEDQWLDGFPHEPSESVGWRWWQGQ